MTITAVESIRLEEQSRIDASKTINARRRLGQFATPPDLARDIARETVAMLDGNATVEMLEPSAGTGAFLSAFFSEAPGRVRRILAVELDLAFHDAQKRIWQDFPVDSRMADFTALKPDRFVDLVVANPPYVRHHNISAEVKQRLQADVMAETGLRLSGLSSLYCYFMLLSVKWMKPDAIGAWLVPTEWMSVNYGSAIRSFLSERVRLLRVHRFDSEDVRFSDALVSSCLVWFRNAPPADSVTFTSGGDITHPSRTEEVSVAELRQARKWPPTESANPPSAPRLRDFFTIRRGIATGDNPFFILPQEKVQERGIPSCFLKPILPSPRHLKTDRILSDEAGIPVNANRQFLLDCTGIDRTDLPESVMAYLTEGEATTASKKLCAGRTRWYDQEQRSPAPILCSYMGRGKDDGTPVRFILNESAAIATNSFLMLYPKGSLRRVFAESPEAREAAWRCLLSIPAGEFRRAGRCYGGGLQKMEPRELGDLLCQKLADWLSERIGFQYRQEDSGQLLFAMEPESPDEIPSLTKRKRARKFQTRRDANS
ncbi:MAG: Eco57I restriction-modification methylase domain-containing protein [Kiritimatiellae bacterium]|nr:Eco57I restriction-modification methylase domain-containing protein [Kiritimatiellia bacterium]